MFFGISDVAVLATTILSLAIASIWYSPLLFGGPWMRALGMTEEDFRSSKGKMFKLFSLGFIANGLFLYTLARLIVITREIPISLLDMSILITITLATVAASTAIWEQKPLSYLLVNIGYIAIVVIGGMHVIALWPW